MDIKELENINCDCEFHRYHVAHICVCGQLVTHSQGSWELHKFCGGMIDFNPHKYYNHGDSVWDVWDRLLVFGVVHSQPAFCDVYMKLA